MKKEYNILNYFNMRALFMGIGLSRILSTAKEYTLLSLLLGTIIGIIIIYLTKCNIKNNIIKIIANIFLITNSILILINMISTMYLTNMPNIVIGLPILLLLLYIINKNDVIVYRISNILLVFNISLYIIAILCLFNYFDITNFYYTNTDKIVILKCAFEYALYSTVPTLITRNNNTKDISLIKTYIISSITMSIMFLLTYGILGSNLVSILRYPEYIILKRISIGDSIQNIENIISFMWLFDIFVLLMSSSISLKECLKNKTNINYIIPVIFLVLLYSMNYYSFIIFFYKYLYLILFILLLLLIINKTRDNL